jgi:O-methyltransferase involved in polyketide biosynthesis
VSGGLSEEVVERAVADGVRQYVILGAGLDSFAYRRSDVLDRVRVFEVDHPASQAVWSWLGVTMYLTPDAIRATLATIAECSSGTRVVLTYNLPRPELDGLSLSLGRAMHSIVSGLGEPMISLFTPAEIEQLVRALGYDEISRFGPEESRTTYFADRDDGHFGGPQRILIATVAGMSKAS